MDAVVQKLIARRLMMLAEGGHPGPDLLAAFAERGVSASERDILLQHLAACSGCREILYAAAPEFSNAQTAYSAAPRRPRLAFRWATLAASVIIVGSVIATNRGRFTRHSPPTIAEIAPAGNSANETAPRAISSTPPSERLAGSSQMRNPAKFQPPLKHMTAKPQAGLQFDESGEVHFAAAPAAPARSSGADTAAKVSPPQAQSQMNSLRQADAAAVPSLWKLSPDGSPLRSTDDARSWQVIPVQPGVHFRVVNTIGDEVWLGGSAGELFHSSDRGETWSKVEPAYAGAKLNSDIAGIAFRDAQNGALKTADGQTWTTSDGGKTWRLQ
jgi:hypothetical protein